MDGSTPKPAQQWNLWKLPNKVEEFFLCEYTKSVTGVVALRSKWAAGKAVRAGLAVEGAYLNRYVTEEQRGRRPIFIATLRAARLLAGCFVAHRSKTTAGILPLRFAHPAKIRSSATTPVTDLVH